MGVACCPCRSSAPRPAWSSTSAGCAATLTERRRAPRDRGGGVSPHAAGPPSGSRARRCLRAVLLFRTRQRTALQKRVRVTEFGAPVLCRALRNLLLAWGRSTTEF